MLEHESDMALAGAAGERVFAVERNLAGIRPVEPGDDPQQRGLARARRPEQRQQFAVGDLQIDAVERGERAELLHDILDFNRHAECCPSSRCRSRMVFATSVISASIASKRGDRERRHELIFVVENLDQQRHGVGLAANMSRHHRHRAEFAHRPRIAQQHAIQHAPFDIGQGDAEEGLQARRAERDRGLLLLRALLLHQRNQRARDERKRHEDGRKRDAGHREQHMDIVACSHGPQ